MRRHRAIPFVVATALAALALSSCGSNGDELLPGDTASEIEQNLDQVRELVETGDCVGAEDATAEVLVQVEDAEIDPRLEEALEEGIDLLSSLVLACEEEGETDGTTPAIEPAEEPEDEERGKQGKGQSEEESGEPEPGNQGKGKGPEKDEPEEEATEPPAEPETPSGGLGPGEPAEGQ